MIGISPAEDFVVFHEDSQRWLLPEGERLSRANKGRRLIDVDAEWARRIEHQVDALAELVAREGVIVHRPQRLEGAERTFLAPNGEGAQLFPRDGMIVIGNHVIEASLRLLCRQRERYGLRPIIQQVVRQRGARWSSVPLGSPGCVDGPFLEGGDTLLNGHEIYVGISGCASDLAGADWLEALLGEAYRVIPVAMKSNVLHLDCALALIKPGLLVYCPPKLIDGLPMSLRDWDKIEVSMDEANRLATNGARPRGGPRHHRRRQRAGDRGAAQAQDRRHSPAVRRADLDRRRLALRAPSAAAGERAGLRPARRSRSCSSPPWGRG